MRLSTAIYMHCVSFGLRSQVLPRRILQVRKEILAFSRTFFRSRTMLEAEGYIKPSLNYYSSDVYETVKLRVDSNSREPFPPISVPALLQRTVDKFPDSPALSFHKGSNVWKTITFKEYKEKIVHVAKAFIKLGLQPRNTVAVISFNCPEWHYAELAAIYAGGIITGIYTTNSAEAVFHVLDTSQATILIVDDSKQMKKVHQIWTRLPSLKAVIQINGIEGDISAKDGYYKWSDIEEMDTSDLDDELQYRLNNILINECCCLIYTSGTVGSPKAVMLSHDNITYSSQVLEKKFGNVIRGEESIVTYLPMNHVAAQLFDVFFPILIAGCVHFADRDALKGTLIKTLSKVHPTRFMGVPRVYEKFYEQLIRMESQLFTVNKALLNWAQRCALRHHLDAMQGKPSDTWQYKMAKELVLKKIKRSLGLDQSRISIVGAAPTSTDIKKYFLSIDVPITEVYGMSESAGVVTLSNYNAPNMETVGKPLEGISVKIFNPDSDGVGEICFHARTVFMGYSIDPKKTREALDEDGWLHTGDLGKIDDEGYLYITGRLKELLITAGGENIPPVQIENLVKTELPVLSNTVLVGDRRKFLTILLTLKTEFDSETGIPKEELLPEVIEWLQGLNLPYTTLSEILNAGPCPIVRKAIQDGINRANENATSNAQKVQKFALLPHDFSTVTGELGPTLKLMRNIVIQKYSNVIEELYKC